MYCGPLDKKLIFWIVTRVSARDYTVYVKQFKGPNPLHWQFLPYKSWHFWRTYPPLLVIVVHEQPLIKNSNSDAHSAFHEGVHKNKWTNKIIMQLHKSSESIASSLLLLQCITRAQPRMPHKGLNSPKSFTNLLFGSISLILNQIGSMHPYGSPAIPQTPKSHD